MFTTFVITATLVASLLLVLGDLRTIARDTARVMSDAAEQAWSAGVFVQRSAFFSLWAMIFMLSFY
ncbi:hypothetical protein [Aestuariicoccus sp. MJ-SS9]|uniref:hypothetical protein n=1 Tax=Aestuariicoccus sp. MJ-SS9 TaxID=3079855 RepID=UPI00290BCD8B|nr:hypothetical protein [Aestuariicoccus sp. MJ-SS9]MDU8909851.1 hypothetical protein [Aestuariicoccus sp. MJ-SS9]